jgi:hypothetical membrane protein
MRESVAGSTRAFALCGIAAPVFYVLGTALAAMLRPDYSLIHHTVSRLGEQGGDSALLFIYLGQVPYGLLTAAFAIALYRVLGTGTAVHVGSVLLAIGGAATVVAFAVFPRNAAPAPPGAAHLWSGLVQIVAGTAAMVVLASPLRGLGRGYFSYSLACGVALAIWLAGALLGPFRTYPGFWARLAAAIALAWIVVIALRILRDREPARRS